MTAFESVQVPKIDALTLSQMVEYATSFSAANGLQVEVASAEKEQKSYVTAPISLLPQCYPLSQFHNAISLAAPFNELVDRISRDGLFLKETLKDVRGVDEYTGKLLELYEEIYMGERKGMDWGKHARSADRLGIQRSDYMLHRSSNEQGEYSLKQVELNTIASSFAGLAATVAKLHSFLTKRLDLELANFLHENEVAVMGGITDLETSPFDDAEEDELSKGVPQSPSMMRIPLAIAVAYSRYSERFIPRLSTANTVPVILFVVQPNETNTVDQRLLELALWNNHKVPVVRMSLAEVYKKMTLDEETGRLTFETGRNNSKKHEVAVVYFRAGYAPTDYPSGYNTKDGSGVEWLARERLERSAAAKCPSLGYHLAGTKKVQQELARPGAVERFFPKAGSVAANIRTAFAGLYSLGADANEQDLRAVKEVLFTEGGQGRYVLKPQREGGGYNYYGKDLAEKLGENCTITRSDGDNENSDVKLSPSLSEFILMERLFPPQQRAILLRNGKVEGTGMTISELGCFGTIVASGGDTGEVILNEYAGFLLRTKFSGVDEGGVASGFATLSSPFIC
eukprot:CAMPEP_0183725300 /NCGR_PEP_ID=MMETSP0737-20130205/20130_1 /TAXON_ID=385413 /ORGANISM="Thalassiosira miniscula, Strain CCMP1093" /LENGTH=568 /DNA_ID=CAMNT_0025956233 /DNA_START=168 /DNA_END=1874 /DNA_ORIENTATION=+